MVLNERWKNELTNWIVIPAIGALVIQIFVDFNAIQSGRYLDATKYFVFSFIFWSVLANGNHLIVNLIDKRWSWVHHPVKRTIIGIAGLLVFTIPAIFLIMSILVWVLFDVTIIEAFKKYGIFNMLAFPLGITVVMALWGHGRSFLMEWRQASIDVERLKTENLKSRFESLRNQVNPHFLFNSLNALSSLVYDDQDKAVDFIQKLSQVYRYVLDHQNDEVVDLESEVHFLESFVYLNKIRFGNNLNVTYEGFETLDSNLYVPPVVLQMLVENCLKHNEISKEKKLNIQVKKDKDSITITNNRNPLNTPLDSSGLGLKNIQMRYEMLSGKHMVVSENKDRFSVQIPLLTLA